MDLDGSHTPAKRGGEAVEYQGRKKAKTTNSLYLTDRQGLPLSMSEPVAGNHNDLYNIDVRFEEVTATLEQAKIDVTGLFLNADAGFVLRTSEVLAIKSKSTPTYCFNKRNGNSDDRDNYFDQELYDERYAVERTNAWMDSYRSLLNRFDTSTESWKGFNYLSFIVIAVKKINKMKNIKV